MQYRLQPLALRRIWSFYRNVSLKYSHTYSLEDMHRNVRFAIESCYLIENTLARRKPTLQRWDGCFMAKAGKWYYAYVIDGNTIIIKDACHQQNMHND